jgi:hypothetical protein
MRAGCGRVKDGDAEPQRHRGHRDKKRRGDEILSASLYLSALSVPLWFKKNL